MNIWLISIFEQTPVDNVFSTRFLSVAEEALSRGHKVTFFASTFKHNTKNQRFSRTTTVRQSNNYELVFIKSLSYRKNISVRRMWSHFRFAKRAISVLKTYEKPDVILMAFPPITLTYEVSVWAKRNKIPLIMDIIDPWPDIFEKAMPKWLSGVGSILFSPQKRRLKKTLANISGLTAISNQYIQWAKGYVNTIEGTECLYPAADFNTIQGLVKNSNKSVSQDGLKIIYAGSLASSYDIECILAAAGILFNQNDIKFLIAGAGPKEALIKEYQTRFNNVEFLGRLDKETLMSYYAKADLGLTQHVKEATQSVTYKLFDLLSAGLPILNSLESEMADIIVKNKVGLHNFPGDSSKLAENILFFRDHPLELESFKENALNLAKNVGNTTVVYGRFVDILESHGIKK